MLGYFLDGNFFTLVLFGALEASAPILKPDGYALGRQLEQVGQTVDHAYFGIVSALKG